MMIYKKSQNFPHPIWVSMLHFHLVFYKMGNRWQKDAIIICNKVDKDFSFTTNHIKNKNNNNNNKNRIIKKKLTWALEETLEDSPLQGNFRIKTFLAAPHWTDRSCFPQTHELSQPSDSSMKMSPSSLAPYTLASSSILEIAAGEK